eukprot:gb/GECH01010285.1/.p1 GENE.gb/GECH01010285.1/~~gb/GECH01010285.1/.p1  ORF type:complete len:134 (+),score=16.40 gb/GECH01010285.1/:1-402(+)
MQLQSFAHSEDKVSNDPEAPSYKEMVAVRRGEIGDDCHAARECKMRHEIQGKKCYLASLDSDYFIYDIPYYLPLDRFRYQKDGDNLVDIEATCFEPRKLAEDLGLPQVVDFNFYITIVYPSFFFFVKFFIYQN